MFKFSLGSFGAFPIFRDLISRKPLVTVVSKIDQHLGHRDNSLVPGECLSLLSVQEQFGVIPCISCFGNLVSTFDLNIQDLFTAKFIRLLVFF